MVYSVDVGHPVCCYHIPGGWNARAANCYERACLSRDNSLSRSVCVCMRVCSDIPCVNKLYNVVHKYICYTLYVILYILYFYILYFYML